MLSHKSSWFKITRNNIFNEGTLIEVSRPVTVEELKQNLCDIDADYEPITEAEYKERIKE